jgi:DNA-directed RNA polymerase subunit RPC12/RpoP
MQQVPSHFGVGLLNIRNHNPNEMGEMTQYCQQCYKPVEFAEGSTSAIACPSCGARVVPSAGYAPSVGTNAGVPPVPTVPPVVPPVAPSTPPTVPSTPTPPPGLKPQAEAASLTATAASADAAHGSFGLTLSPHWLTWVPVGCLAVCLILLFFTWVDVNLGGYSVMSQSAWNTMGGTLHAIWPNGEEWTTLEKTLAGTNDSRKEATLRSDGLMVFYILILFLTLPLLVVDRLFTTLDEAKLPPYLKWLPAVWKYRVMVLVGLLVLLLFLLSFQSLQRFGLEKALYRNAETTYKVELEKAVTDSEKKAVYIKIGQEAGKYPAHTTGWVSVAVFLHTLAVLAMLAREWLVLRGNKPLPRIGFSW